MVVPRSSPRHARRTGRRRASFLRLTEVETCPGRPANTAGPSAGRALYWLLEGSLIATTDQGMTWKKLSDVKNAQYGPIFGRDAAHLFVLTTNSRK